MHNTLKNKTSNCIAGFMLSACFISSIPVYANNLNKDPSLVAFYNDVFGKDNNKQAKNKTVKKQKVRSNHTVKINDECVSHPSSSENEFALDLKNQREQKNLRLLMSDSRITKQTDQINKEISRLENSESQIYLDLIQASGNSAQINLGERKVRCKQKPKAKLVKKPKNKLKAVAKAPKPRIEIKPEPNVVQEPIVIKKPIKKKKKVKSTFTSQAQPQVSKGCTAKNTNASAEGGANDMAALFAKAFGKKAAVAKPSKISATVRIDKNELGELYLYSDSSGSIDETDTEAILKVLEDVLKDHVYLRFKKALVSSKKTRLCKLNELGIIAIYNETNLSLDLTIKPELRKPLILSMLSKKKASVREENIVEAEKFSAYLNAFTTVGLNSAGNETDVKMRLEGSLNLNGFVLESTGDYRNEAFELGRTTLTYDKPEQLKRFSLGNISTGNRNFQENLELDGFKISKEFFLDPDLQISPRANESLQLDTDSEVELYINNQMIRRFYLNAGVYSLQDIGLYNGANNIRIRIKDEFGKVTVKQSKQYYDSHLLKPGLSLYSISVGYLSNQQSYSSSLLENKPILSGYYQRGISKDLTLSFDAQFSSENFLFGTEAISSIPLGSLRSSLAISGGREQKTGYAASFEFKPNKKQEKISLDTLRQDLLGLDTRSRGLINGWTITGEFRSEDFATINGVDPNLGSISDAVDGVNFGNRLLNNTSLKGNLQTNFHLHISEKWQGNLSLGVADYYNSDESYYANLSASKRFENGTRLSVGTRYDTEDEFSMNVQISIPLSRKKGKKKIDFDVLADSRDNSYETKLSMKPTSLVGKNSLAGSLEHFQNENSKQQLLDLQYRNNYVETKLTARNRKSNGSNSSSQQLNFGFNTSLACVGSGCAVSYPINDSFALVSGPTNQTQPIALSNNGLKFRYSDGNNTGLPDNYTALIPSKGKKAVVRLESYRTQNINIDEGTLPNGYDAEKTEFAVFPKYHQGFALKAGGEPSPTVDGMLLDDQNKGLPFKGGQWIPLKEGKTVAFFSNKSGKFRVTAIPAGKYKLELFDYPDMEPIQINVPKTKGKPHDIGNLIIKTPN